MSTHQFYIPEHQIDEELVDILRDVVAEFTEEPYQYESDQARRARLWAARTKVTDALIKILREHT